MTMQSERLRVLREAVELLDLVQADPNVDGDVRLQAADFAARYPAHERWLAAEEVGELQLSAAEAAAVFEAGLFFEGLSSTKGVSREALELCRFVMRHYPSRQDGCNSPASVRWLIGGPHWPAKLLTDS